MKKRVLLGMSGGVDSSTSAILLQEAGYEVIGCTMRLWDPECDKGESTCCGSQAVYDAKRVCDKLHIPHYTLNCKSEFKEKVVNNFIEEYLNARTPNPCIECNRYLKFGDFYKKAQELECDYIATGHYAKTEFSDKYNQYVLKKSKEIHKDQSYFLYTMKKEIIEHIIFPLQDYKSKDEIRQIANKNELNVANKKDSQEVCFIPDNDYQGFLKRNMNNTNAKNGNIVLTNGDILGKHTGLINYTVGQRKGIGISYKEPLYVIKLDKNKNEVVVGTEKELYKSELIANDINWLITKPKENEIRCYAKIRYRAKEAKAKLLIQEENVKVTFEEPQRAITPGQSIVFYDEDGTVLGGGKID